MSSDSGTGLKDTMMTVLRQSTVRSAHDRDRRRVIIIYCYCTSMDSDFIALGLSAAAT